MISNFDNWKRSVTVKQLEDMAANLDDCWCCPAEATCPYAQGQSDDGKCRIYLKEWADKSYQDDEGIVRMGDLCALNEKIDREKLLSSDHLVEFLRVNGPTDSTLSIIREKYFTDFGNELVWLYPLSDEKHTASFIVAVQEGYLLIPYTIIAENVFEILEIDSSVILTSDMFSSLISDFADFSEYLLNTLYGMRYIVHQQQPNMMITDVA